MRRVRICCSMRTIRWSGIPGARRRCQRRKTEDTPILLSIGYSACHWCHVMAHESFEDEEIAAVMNENFVCIKVDREERPDLDSIYMTAVQMMTGSGGWPMTVFLTPDQVPFYCGTYFPPEDRYGMPGFRRVLLSVAQAYRERREGILRQRPGHRHRSAKLESFGRRSGQTRRPAFWMQPHPGSSGITIRATAASDRRPNSLHPWH